MPGGADLPYCEVLNGQGNKLIRGTDPPLPADISYTLTEPTSLLPSCFALLWPRLQFVKLGYNLPLACKVYWLAKHVLIKAEQAPLTMTVTLA